MSFEPDPWDLVVSSSNFELDAEVEDISRFNRMFKINFAQSDWMRGRGLDPKVNKKKYRVNRHASDTNTKNVYFKRMVR